MEEKKEVCELCDGTGTIIENQGMCGGCEICGATEETEKPCPSGCPIPPKI